MAGSVAKGRDAVSELLLNLTIYLANRRLHVGRTTCSSSFTPIKMANFSETFLAANYIMQFSRNSFKLYDVCPYSLFNLYEPEISLQF